MSVPFNHAGRKQPASLPKLPASAFKGDALSPTSSIPNPTIGFHEIVDSSATSLHSHNVQHIVIQQGETLPSVPSNGVVIITVEYGSWPGSFEAVESLVQAGRAMQPGPMFLIADMGRPPFGMAASQLQDSPFMAAYTSHIASLSLYENTYVQLAPPPETQTGNETELKDIVRQYVSILLEAMGTRLVFGNGFTTNDLWFDLCRQIIIEFSVDQQGLAEIFKANAVKLFGEPKVHA